MSKGRHMVPKGLWHPYSCRDMLNHVVGVMQTVWSPITCVGERGIRTHCGGEAERQFSRTSSQLWGSLNLPIFPVKGWFIDPAVHGLLDGPSDVVHLPAKYGAIVNTDAMQRGITMVIY